MKKIIFLLGTGILFSGCVGTNTEEVQPQEYTPPLSSEISEKQNTPMIMPENFSSLDADVFEKLMHSNQYITIDVRRPEEISQGKVLKNALEMDYYSPNFLKSLNQLDKKKRYLIYCHSGARSGRTVSAMQNMGFSQVYDLQGGIAHWEKIGKKQNQ